MGGNGALADPEIVIVHSPKTPFIDVSHDLQEAADDRNCALYSLNFIKAISELLKSPEIVNHIVELARSSTRDPSAIEQLVHIFREDLKAYLPCYYDRDTGLPKSPEEVEAFHLSQRWELGSKSVELLHPLEEKDDGLEARATVLSKFSTFWNRRIPENQKPEQSTDSCVLS
jgi:hypothetical protein